MRRRAALVALLLVTAGCAGVPVSPPADTPTSADPATAETPTPAGTAAPPATGTRTPTRTPSPTETPPEITDPETLASTYDIEVKRFEDNLTVDQNLVFARVQVILGTRVEPPEVVDVQGYDRMSFPGGSYPPFYRALGVDAPEGDRDLVAAGLVRDPDTVYLNEIVAGDTAEEHRVLAHEYVHVTQFRRGDAGQARQGIVEGDLDPDERQVYVAMVEGAAVHASQAYWREYLHNGTSPAEQMADSYRETSGAQRLVFARYHFGYRYFAARTASPRGHERVYRNPPRTTEQLLHRLPGGTEPPTNLSVGVQEGHGWDSRPARTVRMGELFVRVALSTQVNESRAADAAAGWGTDERHLFKKNGTTSWAWVVQWDDRRNATEFERAFRAYLGNRATRNGSVWVDGDVAFRLERVSDRTVVVFLGNESFVRTAVASAEDGRVTIET